MAKAKLERESDETGGKEDRGLCRISHEEVAYGRPGVPGGTKRVDWEFSEPRKQVRLITER
jgi:hypothetical protein